MFEGSQEGLDGYSDGYLADIDTEHFTALGASRHSTQVEPQDAEIEPEETEPERAELLVLGAELPELTSAQPDNQLTEEHKMERTSQWVGRVAEVDETVKHEMDATERFNRACREDDKAVVRER